MFFPQSGLGANYGVRYEFGDLQDVVNLLNKSLHTRQAFLPIWFPEDTGVVHGERVPCTLGYHFLVREDLLNIVYYIRSCDFLRHFPDDVYMACRLAQWVADKLPVDVGSMVMHISSLHIFEGDMPRMEQMYG
jgi:thymidylate synthase